ncbi:MAG TPA: class I SAM-dependent methyltransferase [Bryobacteraceae bacterium]|nr:class I SAM-dependent methyltransferase [Bryobacteraceae bacterium]
MISSRPPAALARILERTSELGFQMGSEERTGALLRVLAGSKPGGCFLELGTGTGIATAWILDGMDEASTLISVDIDAKFQEVARHAFAGDARLQLVTEDALGFLHRQASTTFDLAFADAMPGKYDGLDEALRVVKLGGFYVIDDMLPQANWPEGHAPKVAALLAHLAARRDIEIVSMEWASGVVVAVRKQ